MKRALFFIVTFFLFSLTQAQTIGDYTVVSQVDGYYITATTATGNVTFPTIVEIEGETFDVKGVANEFTSSGSGITTLTIPIGYTTFESNCFRGLKDVESIVFLSGEVFGDKIMRNLPKLKSVVLPNTITSWGIEIFSDGSGIETIDLGNCPTINRRMFQNNPITDLTLPTSVTHIGESAWFGSNIKTLIVKSTTPAVIDVDWAGVATNITAYVPTDAVETYKSTAIWRDMIILDQSEMGNNPIDESNVIVPLGGSIQTAINTVATSGGGTVTLKEGTHIVSTPLKIRSNVTLQGEGDWQSILKTNTNIEVITAYEEGMSNIIIQNIKIEGVNGVNGGGIQITSQGVDHDNIQILNVHCIKTGWGVHIKGATNLFIKDCLFEENGAVTKEGFAHNLYLRRVYGAIVRDSKFLNSISANGINISYSSDVEVHNCEMSGNYFRGVRAAVTDGYVVHDCIVKNNGDRGIYANSESGQTATKNVDIKRNCVSGNKLQGIATVGGATGIVTDNNSYNNGTNYDLKGTITESNNIVDSSIECIVGTEPNILLTTVSESQFISLNWSVNNIALGIQNLYRSTTPNFNESTLIVENIEGNTYADDLVEKDIVYWYWLEIIDESNEKHYSKYVKGAVVTKPTVLLDVKPGNGFVTLNWDVYGIEVGDTGVLQIFRQVLISNNENEQAVQSQRSLIKNNVTGNTYIDSSVFNNNTYKYGFKVTDKDSNVYNAIEVEVTPSLNLSIENIIPNNKVNLFTNPVTNYLTLTVPLAGVNKYVIFNINGKECKQGVVSENTKEIKIDLNDFKSGIYLINIKGKTSNDFFRFLKN